MEDLCEHVHLIRIYEGKNTYANEDDYLVAMNVVMSLDNSRSCTIVGARGDLEAYTQKEKREAMERFNVIVALYGGYDEIKSKRNGKWRTFEITNCLER